jgi:hypothetical protein
MVAPSGRAFLDQHQNPGGGRSGVEIICAQCFFETAEPEDRIELAAKPEIVVQEILNAQPNTWKERN